MSDDATVVVSQTITIAVDTGACTPLTVELAVELAIASKGQLQGLFIEDADLLSTARLPFSCEITLATGQTRGLDPQQLQNSFNRLANQFRQLLAQKAEQSVLQYSFHSMQGRKQDLLKQNLPGSGYLIVDRSTQRLHWKATTGRVSKRILIVEGASPGRLNGLLELIAGKFTKAHFDLLFLKTTEPSALPQKPVISNCSVHWVEPSQVESLLWDSRVPLDFILVDNQADGELLERLVREASCPVIVAW